MHLLLAGLRQALHSTTAVAQPCSQNVVIGQYIWWMVHTCTSYYPTRSVGPGHLVEGVIVPPALRYTLRLVRQGRLWSVLQHALA